VRQLRRELGRENVMFVHVVPIIQVSTSGEMKSKPLQHSVVKLREMGIHPSILVCRTTKAVTPEVKKKIAMFSDLDYDRIIEARDQKSIYSVPLAFQEQDLHNIISERLR
jgi:CTP synthase